MLCSRAFASLVAALVVGPFFPALGQQEPTAYDQFMLELINRGRLDPDGELSRYASSAYWGGATPDLNEGLAAGTISSAPKQVLAFNGILLEAAQSHSSNMNQLDTLSHDLGPSYGGFIPERLQPYSSSLPGSNFNIGESIANSFRSPASGYSESELIEQTLDLYERLFVDTLEAGYAGSGRPHRENMLSDDFREVGLSMNVGTDEGGSLDSIYLTQDFGLLTLREALLTGVIYNDVVLEDDFYTPGEGVSDVRVEAWQSGALVDSVEAFESGGYALELAAGEYEVRFVEIGSGDTFHAGWHTLGAENYKLDAMNASFSAVPEPSVAALLVLSLAAFAQRRRV